MKTVTLSDEAGCVWQVLPDDTLKPYLDALLSAGFEQGSLVIPRELPLSGTCLPPDWSGVIAEWEQHGDSPALRRLIDVQSTRQALYLYIQATP